MLCLWRVPKKELYANRTQAPIRILAETEKNLIDSLNCASSQGPTAAAATAGPRPQPNRLAPSEAETVLVGPTIKVAPGATVVQTLRTGQSLLSGFGPTYGYRKSSSPHIFDVYESLLFKSTEAKFSLQIELSQKDVLRWDLAAKATTREWSSYRELGRDEPLLRLPAECFCLRSKNFSTGKGTSFDHWRGNSNVLTLPAALIALSSAYGGIHMVAWNFDFPTSNEHLLWKFTCIELAGYLFAAAFVWMLLVEVFSFTEIASHGQIIVRSTLSILPLLLALALVLNFPLYVVSRVYIVVESFISLRHVPIGVYAAVPWSNYIPHI